MSPSGVIGLTGGLRFVRAHPLLVDLAALLGLALLFIATGIGLRDAWPADEPRFALIARDMVASGDWLLPRIGGEVYADKPPLYFWLLAAALAATGSLRSAFLLPSLLASLGCVALVYDLGRRLWNRETGLAAGAALLLSLQFVWQARQAQIDATLCFFTTLALYGLLRHLLAGPDWRWYAAGWAAAGLGVITKGVGFLPLLLLLPYALLRDSRWQPRPPIGRSLAWMIGPLAFAVAIGSWLVPLFIASSRNPLLAAYRDEILWQQTLVRYAAAWHHREPFWYFLANVIPLLWLPLTALLPWLVPRWRAAWGARDLRVALLLAWTVLVIVFFSLSSGKRGVYVLPALPAFSLAAAPWLAELSRRPGPRTAVFGVAALLGVACALAAGYLLVRGEVRTEIITDYGIDALPLLGTLAAVVTALAALLGPRRGFLLYAAALLAGLLLVSFGSNPAMNAARSGRAFVERIERAAAADAELGFLGAKEQYLLRASRPLVHFGHARWREWEQEAADAALWLAHGEQRRLVVHEAARALCFGAASATPLGRANRIDWYLVHGTPDPGCTARGRSEAAQLYVPPGTRPAG